MSLIQLKSTNNIKGETHPKNCLRMNSKELVRNMIAFLNERHDMDCATLRQRFAVCYGMSEDEAKKVILDLTMLQIFAENFGVEI